jgi:hypothetical protein
MFRHFLRSNEYRNTSKYSMQAIKLARKYPSFSQEQMMQLVDQFK